MELIERGGGAEVVLIIATIHGSERAGTPLVRELARRLEVEPGLCGDRSVVLLPVVNPDGARRRSRFNAAGVDLNRNFPAPNRRSTPRSGPRPLSEPESRFIHGVLARYRPARVISIHQPLSCIDYDGPAAALAAAMARACHLEVRKLGARPGSLGSFTGAEQGIPTITLELPRGAEGWSVEELWKRYGRALLVAIEGL